MHSEDKRSESEGGSAGAAMDLSLMDGLCRKRPGAMAALYDRYGAILFAMCIRSLKDHAEAEDLLMDVFIELWERADRYDAGRGSPRTYIFGVARSRIIDRLRARRSRDVLGRVADSAAQRDGRANPALFDNPLSAAMLAESRARVAAALQSLSPDQRAALEMVYFDAMTHVEISQRLDTPVGTIKSRIRQALIQLRKLLGVGDAGANEK